MREYKEVVASIKNLQQVYEKERTQKSSTTTLFTSKAVRMESIDLIKKIAGFFDEQIKNLENSMKNHAKTANIGSAVTHGEKNARSILYAAILTELAAIYQSYGEDLFEKKPLFSKDPTQQTSDGYSKVHRSALAIVLCRDVLLQRCFADFDLASSDNHFKNYLEKLEEKDSIFTSLLFGKSEEKLKAKIKEVSALRETISQWNEAKSTQKTAPATSVHTI